VQYELRPQDLDGPADRKGNFHQDKSVPRESRASDADYVNSGFDRGHMAPADHMDRNDGVMYESFALSNACPQVGDGFNSHIWAYLEAAVKDWVETRGPLTVITGPIFEVVENRVEFETIGEGRVAVPDAFYKIVVDNRNPDKPEALAFRLPNEALPGEEFEDYLTSVDAIEAETGLDFLTALPETVERSLEREVAEQIW
jgi:endonuclease G